MIRPLGLVHALRAPRRQRLSSCDPPNGEPASVRPVSAAQRLAPFRHAYCCLPLVRKHRLPVWMSTSRLRTETRETIMRVFMSLFVGLVAIVLAVTLAIFTVQNSETVPLRFLLYAFTGSIWWIALGAA